jgi:DNA-binding beta-propeller fold protein YncE
MAVVHSKGIIHRDLKPANVLLAEDGTPKITDFGLAKQVDSTGQTASGAILGTPSYMAPEQAGGRRREITRAVDVYALGAILYELLTGRPPFQAETPLDTLLLVVSEEVTPPGELCRAVPRELEAICLKCLQKKPPDRYADAQALADDLQRFLSGEPVSACKATLEQQVWRWLKKRPVGGPITVLMVCVALFSAAALTYLDPSMLLISGWVIWIAALAALFWLPDRLGLRLPAAAFCSLLFALVGGRGYVPSSFADELSVAWLDATTALFFLLPGRPRHLIILWIFFVLINAVTEPIGVLPVGVATCCAGARLIAWATAGDHPAAVFAGGTMWILSNRTSLGLWLYEVIAGSNVGPSPAGAVALISFIAGSNAGPSPAGAVALISFLLCVCAAFISTQVTSIQARQWWRRTIHWMVRPLSGVPLRVWLGVAAACLGLLLGRGVWLWATSRELSTSPEHSGPIWSVAFSPDGERLAVGASRGWALPGRVRSLDTARDSLVVWDVNTGKKTHGSWKWDVGAVYCVAFSPDGERLAVAGDGPIIVLSAAAYQKILDLPTGFVVGTNCLAFSADGRRLAAGSRDGDAKVWDAVTWRELLQLQTQGGHINTIAFSPDGTRLATCATSERVTLWDAATGKVVKTLRKPTIPDVINYRFGAAFSPDGKRLAAGGDDKTVKVWDVETGKEVLSLVGHTDMVQGVAFSPDGKWLASASHDRTVRVWDAESGHEWLRLNGHTSFVYCVIFSPDSRRLASGSEDRTVKIWRVAD